jgi:hypothetical protein
MFPPMMFEDELDGLEERTRGNGGMSAGMLWR